MGVVLDIDAGPTDVKDMVEFVNRIVFAVVFPLLTVCARVPEYSEATFEIFVIFPSASTVMMGILTAEPCIPAVDAPAIFERYPPDP